MAREGLGLSPRGHLSGIPSAAPPPRPFIRRGGGTGAGGRGRGMKRGGCGPVPDWAWAMMSPPLMKGTMARCWMADGFSNP